MAIIGLVSTVAITQAVDIQVIISRELKYLLRYQFEQPGVYVYMQISFGHVDEILVERVYELSATTKDTCLFMHCV